MRSPRSHVPEVAWGVFATANVAMMVAFPGEATISFHFVWVSLMILYGYRVWQPPVTWVVLAVVGVATGVALVPNARHTGEWVELAEIPLMGTAFVVMASYARRREAALAATQRAAEREREFLRNAAHQLRTPIAVARGHAELIRDAAAAPAVADDAAVVVEELDNLARASERLLLLAAAERERFLRVGDLDLEELLVRAVRRWSVVADRSWRVDADVTGTVRADVDRIESALDAVVENAVQATRDGDRIELSARREGAAAVVRIRDEGRGIAPQDLPHLFEPFYSPAREGRGGRRGTGLGLAIVKAIVEAHGGTVEARGAPGRGAVVELRLPDRGDTPDGAAGGPARDARAPVESAC
ncbi:MAG: HAMP domain-containing sensor histidine kinase [Actinomycetota bacterium]